MFEHTIPVLMALYGVAGVVYFIRVLLGPTVLDSILAGDCVSLDVALIALLVSVYYENNLLAGGAFFLVLWAFVLDVFASKYLVKGEVGV
ncbi:pH regulation protein F [Thermococcus indicus]|uniref:pH regulation protein F n=2 Tax=Thermococcus TaxID=2263 RepID=A0A5C0SI95_9EURY|nr:MULTISPECIES: monovalent cation/H+ antiporter complex subunit F [Thermococcus]QDA31246.1 pH regulation protein F [Thermococcus indicus]QEK14295.1 pH regulation protein F [Thermococcus aciditolerans]